MMAMMKQYLLIGVLVTLLLPCMAVAQADVSSRTWQKAWAQVQQGMWMYKTEVSNAEFQAFLTDLKAQGNLDAYYMYYPDTTVWGAMSRGNQPFNAYYFSHPAFAGYPVVGISHQAAEAYCQWLTWQYGQRSGKPFGNVVFRLPDHAEWVKAAQGKLPGTPLYPWGHTEMRNAKGQALANYRRISDMEKAGADPSGAASVTAPVNSHWPNTIGIYNMSGNVAELLRTQGQAAGGSYLDTDAAITLRSLKAYTGPAEDIGFRMVMVRE